MPADNVSRIVDAIRVQMKKIEDNASASVLSIIDLANLYTQLRESVRTWHWKEKLSELGVSERVACRYLKIGEGWWTRDSIEPAVLAQLPCDIHKLEWLSRLEPAPLKEALRFIDCRQASRGAVIKAVQRRLGIRQEVAKPRRVSFAKVMQLCSASIHQMVDAIDNLDPEEVKEEERKALLDELYAQFDDVEEALLPDSEVEEPPPSDSEEDDLDEAEE